MQQFWVKNRLFYDLGKFLFPLIFVLLCFFAVQIIAEDNKLLDLSFSCVSSVLLFGILRFFRLSISHSLILSFAWFVRCLYLCSTPFYERSHDIDGHLGYIEILSSKWQLPKAYECWTCYHPPVYYFFASLIKNLAGFINLNKYLCLQLLSLFFSFGFILFCSFIFRVLFPANKKSLLALSLVVFWPSVIIHSITISNDSLTYLLMSAAIFYFLMWFKLSNWKNLLIACSIALLACSVKANAILVFPLMFCGIVIKYFSVKSFLRCLKSLGVLLAFLLIGLWALLFQNYLSTGTWFSRIVGNAEAVKNIDFLIVSNSVTNFIYFDYWEFISIPFTQSSLGKNFFWNYLLKTSLYGEFGFPEDLSTLAIVVSALLVFILLLNTIVLISSNLSKQNYALLFLCFLLISIGSSIALRLQIPAVCSNDFRYIIPVVLVFGAFSYYSLHISQQSKSLLKYLTFGSLMIFVSLIITFYIWLFFIS